jgi:hypothetical protein
VFIFKLILSAAVNVAILGGILFLPAGTLNWWRAWVFLGIFLAGMLATMAYLLGVNPAILKERFKWPIQKGPAAGGTRSSLWCSWRGSTASFC